MKLPNCKSPCKDCPFRKDSMPGWLGNSRITEILNQDSFVCHKTVDYENGDLNGRLQCAGHLILKKNENSFYQLAKQMNLDIGLKGNDLIFDNEKDCIKHHSL